MKSIGLSLALLLCMGFSGVLFVGCSKEAPPPAPVQVSVKVTPTPLPTATQAPPTITPTARPVRLLLPGWVDKNLKGKIAGIVGKQITGRPLTVVSADDPTGSKTWDIRLMAAGKTEITRPDLVPWVQDSLYLFVNKAMLSRNGIPEISRTWEDLLETCIAHPRGASEPPLLILPGDLPGLPRTLQSLAMVAGANSSSRLDSKPVVTALDFLRQLNQAGFFPVGPRNGTSLSMCARLMGEAHSGLTLGWETEIGWITDPKRSPAGSRVERLEIPRFAVKGISSLSQLTRLWCWEAKDTTLSQLPSELGRFDPGEEVSGKWIGGITDTAKLPIPSDLFTLDTRPGQDFRDTGRIIQEGWSHGTPSQEILKGLEVRFNAVLSLSKE